MAPKANNAELEKEEEESQEQKEKENEETGETLYSKVAEASGIEFDDDKFDSPAEYKAQVCRTLAGLEDAEFEKLPDEVQEWVNVATGVIKENKGKTKKAPIPHLPGLAGDEPKGKGRAKAAKAAKAEKVPKERNPEANRYFKVAELMIAKPSMSLDELEAAAKKAGVDYNRATLNYGRQAYSGVVGALIKHEKLEAAD